MKKITFALTTILAVFVLAGCNKDFAKNAKGEEIHVVDPIAYVHNYVLDELLNSETKATVIQELSSDEHARLAANFACDAAAQLGIQVNKQSVFLGTKENKDEFFKVFGEFGELTALKYIDELPYDIEIKSNLKQKFLCDIQNNGFSFQEYLAELASQETKAIEQKYSYSNLYDFYLSDAVLWNNYYMTKGVDKRHVVGVVTDIVVASALSGLSGLAGAVVAGAVGALASEAIEKGKMDTDSMTD